MHRTSDDYITTMKIHRSTLNRLLIKGKMGNTFEQVVLELLNAQNKRNNEQRDKSHTGKD